MTYRDLFSTRKTPQNEPIPGSSQVPNSAGGHAWSVNDWTRFQRFLILGSEGGSYYASPRKLTKENAEAVLRCIVASGISAVDEIVSISKSGRAPKNEPALFALAMAAQLGDLETKRYARERLPQVARTATHLFTFHDYVAAFGGRGRGINRAVADWYNNREVVELAYQLVKYRQRNGWSHRDVLRMVRPRAPSMIHQGLYRYVVTGEMDALGKTHKAGDRTYPPIDFRLPAIVEAYERAKTASVKELVGLITEHNLPREAVPTEHLNDPRVWEALLCAGKGMPMTAMIRNLATMTRVGLIKPLGETTRYICERLGNEELLRKARIHPLSVLAALKTYEQGYGERGKHTWTPVPAVVDALNDAFYLAFGAVEPTNKRTLLALDVSGSMDCNTIADMPGITPRVGSVAMALVTAVVEPLHHFVAFTSGESWRSNALEEMKISKKTRLDDAIKYMQGMDFGGTDCALPMLWAMERKIEVDTFVIYTDSETWAGKIHPSQALRMYRQATGIGAKLVVVGMVANEFTIADPNDRGMMDVVGFDTATPGVISQFAVED